MERLSYTTKELCEATSTDKHYWYMVEKVGAIRPIKIGKKKMWLKKDIEEYLEWAKWNDVSNEFNLLRSLARRDSYDSNRRTEKGIQKGN